MTNSLRRKLIFLLFFVSGFCSLLLETVWLRLGIACFGDTTPVVSVVVSVFMLGLGLGALLGGWIIAPLRCRSGLSALSIYGWAEVLIAVGAFAVPAGFSLGGAMLLAAGQTNSFEYLLGSAAVILCSMLIWTTSMGATVPFAMAFCQELEEDHRHAFSLLYLANVAGSVLGTIATAYVLIESLGLASTLALAALLNGSIGAAALAWSFLRRRGARGRLEHKDESSLKAPAANVQMSSAVILNRPFCLALLFVGGLASMSMELIWIRAFAPVLGTTIYSYAQLLAVYLLATFAGSWNFRRDCSSNSVVSAEMLLALSSISALLPAVSCDPRVGEFCHAIVLPVSVFVLLSIVPFCFFLGYMTPLLIDELARGNPRRAGNAYAVNVLGCILGPILAGYLLMPCIGARLSAIACALPLAVLACVACGRNLPAAPRFALGGAGALLLLAGVFYSRGWEEGAGVEGSRVVIRRDCAATVASYGTGMKKQLMVNGAGITFLTPITKYMAHLPLVFLQRKAVAALDICFGMGTTYRSLISWGVNTRAVELVPSVVGAFGYYFDDAGAILKARQGEIVIDDGRRYLCRTNEVYDVITIDPPPPVEAAGSALLYSRDFYAIAKRHLSAGGILQQWYPDDDDALFAVAQSLVQSFRFVRIFRSVEGWGYHFLASEKPIPVLSTEQFLAAMPEGAKRDLLEWMEGGVSEEQLHRDITKILQREVDPQALLKHSAAIAAASGSGSIAAVTDDRPYNEYCWLRRNLPRLLELLPHQH